MYTTNLPDVGDIDEALIRPGRCFGVLRTRALTRDETERLLNDLVTAESEREAALARLFGPGVRTRALAEVYRALAHDGSPPQRLGFTP